MPWLNLNTSAIACLTLVTALATNAWARDLPKTDPDRRAILDTVRGTEAVKFVVKDLFKAGDYAFLCALKQGKDDHAIYGTDEAIDVYTWVLVKEPTGWLALSLGGGFAATTRRVDCTDVIRANGKPRPIVGSEDIQDLFVATLEDRVRDDLTWGKVDPATETLLKILVRRKVTADISVEGNKQKIDDTDFNLASRACPTKECRQATNEAYQRLKTRQTDPKISSLVWNACQFGRRRFDLNIIDRCVSEMSPRPHCRPKLGYVSDQKDIAACLGDLRALCQTTMGKDCAL